MRKSGFCAKIFMAGPGAQGRWPARPPPRVCLSRPVGSGATGKCAVSGASAGRQARACGPVARPLPPTLRASGAALRVRRRAFVVLGAASWGFRRCGAGSVPPLVPRPAGGPRPPARLQGVPPLAAAFHLPVICRGSSASDRGSAKGNHPFAYPVASAICSKVTLSSHSCCVAAIDTCNTPIVG